MSKPKRKGSPRPAKFHTYQADNSGGDKGQWLWRVVQGGKLISGCTEHYVHKSDCDRSATITAQAIVAAMTEVAEDDGEQPTDAISTPVPE